MTRTRYKIVENEYPYFVTGTIVGWLPVFTNSEPAEILFNAWRHQQEHRDLKIFAYVILEIHFHMIASAPDLADVLQRFKSFTARKIVELLEQRGARMLLQQLEWLKREYKEESDYQVWQEGSHPKQIPNDEMMWQKIEYIHMNPVKRGFIDDPLHWRWSSARNYAGQPGLIEVIIDWR
ncbi:MAG: transposase [Planctomycetaceae bacterium]